ncbi:hypothetical protein BV25DRAFT_1911522 [Artomyces pyxidatus]|uniref:Uncharacterized protein n=1 Tax=Artomyces pyxidatus TaxID=48021 RepID=A0ACB8TGT1_9AGAM|nr:hypothetical protein BV25DRAFT_1911522 [Artomyces pyxidatus]
MGSAHRLRAIRLHNIDFSSHWDVFANLSTLDFARRKTLPIMNCSPPPRRNTTIFLPFSTYLFLASKDFTSRTPSGLSTSLDFDIADARDDENLASLIPRVSGHLKIPGAPDLRWLAMNSMAPYRTTVIAGTTTSCAVGYFDKYIPRLRMTTVPVHEG